MADHNSGPAEAVKGVVEDAKGKVKEAVGAVTGRDDLTREGQAQQDKVRAERDAAKHSALMERLAAVAKDDRQNIMPITIEAVENGATMGEIVDALKKLWGTYRETPVF